MPTPFRSALTGLVLAAMVAMPALADGLKDEIAPTGRLRVAIAISPAGGAFWSTKTEAGYAGVPVHLGKAMAAQLGVPVEYVVHQNSGQIVKPGSNVTNFASLDQVGIKVAAVNATTTMRGAIAHLKHAKVTGYQTYDEIFGLLKSGEIDAFALARDQLNKMAQKIPETQVLDETFKKTVTAVAVPPGHSQALAFVARFMTEATTNGTLRKAYDNNGLKDSPIRTE